MKLALPKGRLFQDSRTLLQRTGIELTGYDQESRSYRPTFNNLPDLQAKVFQEKDIPIQVAIGNYDLGICGLDWVEELLARYSSSALVKVCDLGYGEGELCAAASRLSGISSIEAVKDSPGIIRIASEYSNLAESLALDLRLKRFKIFPLWGAATAYPPENAELILAFQTSADTLSDHNLVPLATILRPTAFLIANRNSWESQDMSFLIQPLCTPSTGLQRRLAVASSGHRPSASSGQDPSASSGQDPLTGSVPPSAKAVPEKEAADQKLKAMRDRATVPVPDFSSASLRLALPDGHQQQPTIEFLNKAGIGVRGYSRQSVRPVIDLEGVAAKVIRPQDMPLQVANDNFDLAITGRDWLYDHLYRFPTSPVKELLDLGFGWVRIVAVVSSEIAANDVRELRTMLEEGRISPFRVASEYINIADKYARDNHLSPCRLIPTWGASEAFLPEDADLLIENSQTGRTLAEHNLKVIDVLFESSACLIGKANGADPQKIASVVEVMKRGLQA